MAEYQEFADEDRDFDFANEPPADGEASADDPLFGRPSGFDETDGLSTDDLEEAYLKALEAMESAEWAVPDAELETEAGPIEETLSEPVTVAPTGVEIAGADFLGGSVAVEQPVPPADTNDQVPALPQAPVYREPPQSTPTMNSPAPALAIKPLRVIEACLFVGGQPLSAKKLAGLLDGNNEASDIETLIDELNLEYAAQGRPYEIRLGDGGYKLSLRAEFEGIRSRVYGVGPRDVKLSQDVLEVLALVAYQQPITQAAVEACKPNSANILRQLLRRELISLHRINQSRNGVEYTTTARFLQLFGLAQLNELPTPEDLSVR